MEFVIYVKQTQKCSFIYSSNTGFHSFILKVENASNIILRDNLNSTQSVKLHMKHIILGFLHADQNTQTVNNFVLHLLKWELWKQRNLVKFENRIICENRLSEQYRNNIDRVKRIWYLSPMRAAKVHANLHIRAVSPEPPLLAHTSTESRGTFRQKARSLAPLNGWACAVKMCHDGMLEDTNSLDGAQMISRSYHCSTET